MAGERATDNGRAAHSSLRSRLGHVAHAVVHVSRRALVAWCGSEAELRESGALTDERVRAITSLAMSGDTPFAQ
jgi:hypothetical protein